MIVDTHVHFGMSNVSKGQEDLPVEDCLADAAEAGVDRIVQVTAAPAGWDNSTSLKGATEHPDRVVGVIGRFDPIPPDVLNRLRVYKAQPGILGIRITSQWGGEGWLRDRVIDPFFTAAQELKVPIQIFAAYEVKETHTIPRAPLPRDPLSHRSYGHTAQRDPG